MRRGDRKRFVRFQFRRLGITDEASVQIIFARFRRGQRFIGGTAGLLESLVDGGGIGIEVTGMVCEDLGID